MRIILALLLTLLATPQAGYPADFDCAVAFTRQWEGRQSDHPDDRGGETRFGISEAHHDLPDTWAEARAIYYKTYWLGSGANALTDALSFAVFDAAVQHGVPTARRFYAEVRESDTPVIDLFARRASYYHKIIKNDPSQQSFERGWMRRLVAAVAYAEKIKHGYCSNHQRAARLGASP